MGVALRLREQGVLEELTPVLWEFDGHRRVYWERTCALRTCEEDLVLWRAARALRLDELRHPRRRKPRSLGDFLPQAQTSLALTMPTH